MKMQTLEEAYRVVWRWTIIEVSTDAVGAGPLEDSGLCSQGQSGAALPRKQLRFIR